MSPTRIPTFNFVMKLVDVLTNENLSDIIAWHPNGKGFTIHNKVRLVEEVLPIYFKDAKFASFNRRLKRWNFSIQRHGHKKSSYFHPNFIRGDIHSILKLSPATDTTSSSVLKKNLSCGSPLLSTRKKKNDCTEATTSESNKCPLVQRNMVDINDDKVEYNVPFKKVTIKCRIEKDDRAEKNNQILPTNINNMVAKSASQSSLHVPHQACLTNQSTSLHQMTGDCPAESAAEHDQTVLRMQQQTQGRLPNNSYELYCMDRMAMSGHEFYCHDGHGAASSIGHSNFISKPSEYGLHTQYVAPSGTYPSSLYLSGLAGTAAGIPSSVSHQQYKNLPLIVQQPSYKMVPLYMPPQPAASSLQSAGVITPSSILLPYGPVHNDIPNWLIVPQCQVEPQIYAVGNQQEVAVHYPITPQTTQVFLPPGDK